MKDQIINALIVAIVPILLTLGVQAIFYVLNVLKEKAANVKSSLAQRALNKALLVLQTIVESLNNTVVKDLKAKAAAGQINKETLAAELAAVKTKAIETTKTTIGDKTMEIIKHELPEAEEYFIHALEGYVEQLKKNTSTPSLPIAPISTTEAK